MSEYSTFGDYLSDNWKKLLAVCVGSAKIALFTVLAMTMAGGWVFQLGTDPPVGIVVAVPAMIIFGVYETKRLYRRYDVTFINCLFPGFIVVWLVQVLLYPVAPGWYVFGEPSIPTQFFFRSLPVLPLQAIVLLVMNRQQLRTWFR